MTKESIISIIKLIKDLISVTERRVHGHDVLLNTINIFIL